MKTWSTQLVVHSSDEEVDQLVSDSEDDPLPKTGPMPVSSTEEIEIVEEERPAAPRRHVAYIDIVTPPRTSKDKERTKTTGPVFYMAATTFEAFKTAIAAAVNAGSIGAKEVYWRLNVPKSDPKKPLVNDDG